MRILLIEDEQKVSALVKRGLIAERYAVDITADGLEGLEFAETYPYDLIILDLMLPRVSGAEVLQRVRRKNTFVPVLILTARDSIDDKVKLFELGADDYLVKPFAFAELLARVRSLLRRSTARQPDILRFADMEIDLLNQRVTRGGARIDLAPKEFALLSLLARRTGEALPRALLAGQVWEIYFETDTNVVDVAVRRLRAKVDDAFVVKLIHTVRGVGYVLEERGE